MEENDNYEEDGTTYSVSICYTERDTENIESLSKKNAKMIANSLKTQMEAKKEFATVEVDEEGFYIFRMINIKDVQSIDVDEE